MGDGSTNDQNTPIQISMDIDWQKIDTGKNRFGFALKTNGKLYCWGDNVARVLGEDSVFSVSIPTQHNPDSDWQSIACGISHVLAIKTNGTLWGWGNYGYGETGIDVNNPPIPLDNSIPRQIGTENNWSFIAAGYKYSMGIKSNGTLWAWGRNYEGQLGDGSTTNRFVPIQIGSDTNWASVSCGYQSTVALKTDGSMWAWGDNTYGQLGDGTTDPKVFPTQIAVTGCALGSEGFENNNAFVIAPNPTKNTLTITNTANIKEINIYNTLGQLLQTNTQASKTIDVSNLQSGNYFMKIVTESGVSTQRFVKE